MAVQMKVIDASTVSRVLDMASCIELMAAAAMAVSSGAVRVPLRTSMPLEHDAGTLLLMPGQLDRVFGAKLLSIYPPGNGLPAIQGQILLFDTATGTPSALVEASSITAIRTAAASAMATRALANDDTPVLALLGYGVQAASHLSAMSLVRKLDRVNVWGPDPRRAAEFARRHNSTELPVKAVATAREALADADLICTVSAALEPIIQHAWLKPGVHINLVGAHTATTREADGATLGNASVYTEITEFALAESGDLLLAIAEGHLSTQDIRGEIGELLLQSIPGRQSESAITVYISLGNVAQDLAAAGFVAQHAI